MGELIWLGLLFVTFYVCVWLLIWGNRIVNRKQSVRFLKSISFVSVLLSQWFFMLSYWAFSVGFSGAFNEVLRALGYGAGALLFGGFAFYRNCHHSSLRFGVFLTVLQFLILPAFLVLPLWIF